MMMVKEDKKVTTVFVDVEILDHSKVNSEIKNLSEWINTRYPDEFMNLDKEIDRRDMLEKEIEKSKARIKMLKKEDKKHEISKESFLWIKRVGLKRTENTTVEGVLKYFNNQYCYNLSLRQFKIYLEKATGK